jgi:hypothetical protein
MGETSVGNLQSIDPGGRSIAAGPGHRPSQRVRAVKLFEQQVRHDSGVPAVTIVKGMNRYQAMMEVRTSFQRLKGSVLNTVARIIEQSAQFNPNIDRVDTDLFLRPAIATAPPPHLNKQLFMQASAQLIGEKIDPALTTEPEHAVIDAGLFELVQFAPRHNMRKAKAPELVRVERHLPFHVLHMFDHS